MITVDFDHGTLTLDRAAFEEHEIVKWDARTKQYRCRAIDYRQLVEELYENTIEYTDNARSYEKLDLKLKAAITPRPHQKGALDAWVESGKRATVCLPTGAGKTLLAVMAIATVKRSTLILVPTIDLMQQWEAVLSKFFATEIGLLGGGSHEIRPITVATYDSGQMHVEHIGNRFGFLVFDECHHLPGPLYQNIAICSLAPYRLGLSATLERSDGKEELIYELIGPLVYEGQIQKMIGNGLSPYNVVTIEVPMNEEEEELYKVARQVYISFLRSNRIDMSSPRGWQNFLFKSSRSPKGKDAFKAYREQKRLAQASRAKLVELWNILMHHRQDRIIVFTNDNALAYEIGRKFFLAVLTHQTKVKERKKMLSQFKEGDIKVLVTSKVLNEGVDVPDASVGIVVSGSGAVREHVQRLGRILRAKEGKKAVLYELVSKGTAEYFVNKRRREHSAYQGSSD